MQNKDEYKGRLLEPENAGIPGFNVPNTKIAKFGKVAKDVYYDRLEECGFNLKEDDIVPWEELKYPERATKGSAGYDFFSPVSFDLRPKATIFVPTGIRCDMYPGWVLMLYPRSSAAIYSMVSLANTTFVIDSDYCMAEDGGNICLVFHNTSEGRLWQIKKGDRIGQGVFSLFGLTVDDLCNQPVRSGGRGSTGK